MAKQQVLITGASGFVAKNLISLLSKEGYHILATSISSSPGSIPNVELFQVSNPKKDFEKLLRAKPLAIIHAAGRINGKLAELTSANEEFTSSLVSAAENYAPNSLFIYLSSVSAIAPSNNYGRSKKNCEEIIRNSKLNNWTILRPSLIYGLGDKKNVAGLIKLVKRFPLIAAPSDKAIKLQPLFVDDLSKAIVKILSLKNQAKNIYTIAGPKQVSILEMVATIKKTLSAKTLILPVPFLPIKKGSLLLAKLLPFLPIPVQQLQSLDSQPFYDSSPAANSLGFSPIEFDEGIKLTCENKVNRRAN
jgi:nucleoside-diphosphate-sugar epimerase